MDFSVNGHIDQANTLKAAVWFNGDGALVEGQGLCYNWDYGTAATREPRRYNEVELPTILNSMYFAGVTARPYVARTGGQLVEIFLPGSVCNVYSDVSNTIGTGRTTFQTPKTDGTGAGTFGRAGFPGRGSAVPLQTVDRSSTAGLCLCRLEDGEESGGVEELTLTAGGATSISQSGVTYALAATPATDATVTLADATGKFGKRKGYVAVGVQTTNDLLVTVTSGVQLDGSTGLSTLTLDGAGDLSILEWSGGGANGLWRLMHNVGTGLA